MLLPPLGPNGQRMTVNSNLDEDSTLWHFRSAWNVAALNCMDPAHAGILEGYGAFLKKYAKVLSATNTAIDQRFRREHGSRNDAVKAREAYMTQVYNYFALPPARADFCNVAVQIASEFQASPPDDPKTFAMSSLPRYEAVFQTFFRQYEEYRVASAAWDARYGSRYGSSQPGYVAVHGVSGPTVAATLVNLNAPASTGEITDAQTGARIPLIAVPEDTVSTPIVQPVPEPGSDE